MNTLKTQIKKSTKNRRFLNRLEEMPTFKSIVFSDESISFSLSDNRIITIPINWIPKLANASKTVRENFIIRSHFVFWESIDEIIGVKNLINGTIVP